jgi:hypothetical protein
MIADMLLDADQLHRYFLLGSGAGCAMSIDGNAGAAAAPAIDATTRRQPERETGTDDTTSP